MRRSSVYFKMIHVNWVWFAYGLHIAGYELYIISYGYSCLIWYGLIQHAQSCIFVLCEHFADMSFLHSLWKPWSIRSTERRVVLGFVGMGSCSLQPSDVFNGSEMMAAAPNGFELFQLPRRFCRHMWNHPKPLHPKKLSRQVASCDAPSMWLFLAVTMGAQGTSVHCHNMLVRLCNVQTIFAAPMAEQSHGDIFPGGPENPCCRNSASTSARIRTRTEPLCTQSWWPFEMKYLRLTWPLKFYFHYSSICQISLISSGYGCQKIQSSGNVSCMRLNSGNKLDSCLRTPHRSRLCPVRNSRNGTPFANPVWRAWGGKWSAAWPLGRMFLLCAFVPLWNQAAEISQAQVQLQQATRAERMGHKKIHRRFQMLFSTWVVILFICFFKLDS